MSDLREQRERTHRIIMDHAKQTTAWIDEKESEYQTMTIGQLRYLCGTLLKAIRFMTEDRIKEVEKLNADL